MRKLLNFLNGSAPRGNFFRRSVNSVPLQVLICLLATGAVVVAGITCTRAGAEPPHLADLPA